MRGLLVRPVAPADHDAWLVLFDGYNAFYGRSGPTALDAAVTRLTWSRMLDSTQPVHALVAERDGRLIGLAHYLYHLSTTASGPSCYLQDLFTSPDARGGGVGRALIERVYNEARHAGASRVYWQTHETNRTAMQLYDRVGERSGFVVYRTMLA